jgi:hypothetical protein
VREPYSFKWFDYDLDVGVSFPGAYANTDFDDHGPPTTNGTFDRVNNFIYVNLGGQLQFGAVGVSLTSDFLRYTVAPAVAGKPGLSLISGRYHLNLAYGLAHDQVVVGVGLRGVSMQLSASGSVFNPQNETFNTSATLTMTGFSPEAGLVVKPDDLPVRFGATVRAPVTGTTLNTAADVTGGVSREGGADGLILPDQITLPWEFETGFAVQVGPRPLNPPWPNPHDEEAPVREYIDAARARRKQARDAAVAKASPAERQGLRAALEKQDEAIRKVEDARLDTESDRLMAARKARYENWPRAKILVVGSVLITGTSDKAVALEGFLDQQVESVGQRVTVSPRIGIEAEPIPNWVETRVGSYVEPSRFNDVAARQHFTFGGDLKLFGWNMFGLTPGQIWRVSFVLDVAQRYSDYGFALGAWH